LRREAASIASSNSDDPSITTGECFEDIPIPYPLATAIAPETANAVRKKIITLYINPAENSTLYTGLMYIK
jgi:hypothetical protein